MPLKTGGGAADTKSPLPKIEAAEKSSPWWFDGEGDEMSATGEGFCGSAPEGGPKSRSRRSLTADFGGGAAAAFDEDE